MVKIDSIKKKTPTFKRIINEKFKPDERLEIWRQLEILKTLNKK